MTIDDYMFGEKYPTQRQMKNKRLYSTIKGIGYMIPIATALWFFTNYKIVIKEDKYPYQHYTFRGTDKYIGVEKR